MIAFPGSSRNKIHKDKNDKGMSLLEVLVYCNIGRNDYKQDSKALNLQ